jgi:hypothetical protein
MPFSSGTFSLFTPGNPVVAGTTISTSWAQNTLNDIATGLSTCLLKDGSQTVTADLPMAGFKFTGLGAGGTAGDSLRYQQVFTTGNLALIGGLNEVQATTIAAATTMAVGAAAGNYVKVSGTTAIVSLDSVQAGTRRIVEFDGALTFTHNATNLILPGAANITTAAGDVAQMISEGSGNWRCVAYSKASAAPVTLTPITNSISGDVNLNNTGTYFTGPSIAQGSVGTWFVSGTVTVTDPTGSGGGAGYVAKLWDGTTVIASCRMDAATGFYASISLSGYIASPAGDLRISVKDISSTAGLIKANISGESKDSTISAIRIA